MIKVVLIVAALIDFALAVLLLAVSGFVFGGGPEGLKGEFWSVLVWSVALGGSLLAPIAACLLWRSGRVGLGAIIAWVPLFGAVIAMSLPPPY